MNVLVVESPAKAKTINKYLGPGYRVLASFGHVRDLPAKDGSVQPEQDFAMSWEVDPRSQKRLKEIVDALKGADKLILATDPDREGEAISWHVLEILKQKRALGHAHVERVVFNAVTRTAVLDAIAHPREINEELVNSYLARRALRLPGRLHPVAGSVAQAPGRPLGRARAVGRAAARLRARNRDRGVQGAGILDGRYRPARAGRHVHRPTYPSGRQEAREAVAGQRSRGQACGRRDQRAAVCGWRRSRPSPSSAIPHRPFITSTLQQEASRKLGFAAKRTMQIAQQLYEGVDIGGETVELITYMRTDGVQMAGEAIGEARHLIGESYGARYVPGVPRAYASRAKNAQEAHEAIRPTSFARLPEKIGRRLEWRPGPPL